MPRFEPNPNAGSTLRFVAPAGVTEFVIGEPTTFDNDNTAKGGKHSWGIEYPLRIKGGENDGKKMDQGVRLYLHTENTNNINIVFLMAALGYLPGDAEAEAKYKELTEGWDWSFDTDTKEVGAGWKNLIGNIVSNDITVEVIAEGTRMGQAQNQYNTFQWLPFGS